MTTDGKMQAHQGVAKGFGKLKSVRAQLKVCISTSGGDLILTFCNLAISDFGEDLDTVFKMKVYDFLRRLFSGRRDIAYNVEKAPRTNRLYGSVEIREPFEGEVNVSKILVSRGYARVVSSEGSKKDKINESVKELLSLEQVAKENGRGMWGEEKSLLNSRIIMLKKMEHPEKFLSTYKGKPLEGHVVTVFDILGLRLCLKMPGKDPCYQILNVSISGIRNACLDSENLEVKSYEKSAVNFLEDLVLGKEIEFVPEILKPSGTGIMGTAYLKGEGGGNLALFLLLNGVAFVDPNTINACTDGMQTYVDMENEAKNSKTRIWKYQDCPQSAPGHKGTIVKIIGGDTVVMDMGGEEARFCLAAIRVPKPKHDKDKKVHGYDWEAREVLRKYVGKNATAEVCYTSKIPTPKHFARIKVGEKDLGLLLLEKGLADVVRRKIDGCTLSSESMINMHRICAKAAEAKLGMHSKAQVDKIIKDSPKSPGEFSIFAKSLEGATLQGVVEVVVSPTRYRVYIPSMECVIVFNISNIYFPNAADFTGADQDAYNALRECTVKFAKMNFLQRNVTIEIEKIQIKSASFVGTMRIAQRKDENNVAIILLSKGFALVTKYQTQLPKQYKEAEEKASNQSISELVKVTKKKPQPVTAYPLRKVMVSYITHDRSAYFHTVNESLKELKNISAKMNASPPKKLSEKPSKNSFCCAKYSLDNRWYRVKVLKEENENFLVFFVDYGNEELVKEEDLAALDSSINTSVLPPQAEHFKLFGVDDSFAFEDFSDMYLKLLHSLTSNKTLDARIEKGATQSEVILFDTSYSTVNEKILLEGLAVMPAFHSRRALKAEKLPEHTFDYKNKENITNISFNALIARLSTAQEIAKSARRNIWESGDLAPDPFEP